MQRLFDIKKTQVEMVRDRGYTVSDVELSILDMDIKQFTQYVNNLSKSNPKLETRSLLSQLYTLNDEPHLLIHYAGGSGGKQVSIETIKAISSIVQKSRVKELILIADTVLSPKAKEEIATLQPVTYQVFYDHELTYNPTMHVDTPKHELLSKAEAEAKMKELKVDMKQLLIIRQDDPIVRYYGWHAGGIVRVNRDDYTVSILSPKSINYRIIVN